MIENFNVLITDRFDIQALATLKATPGLGVSVSNTPQPTPVELNNCHGLIIRSRTKIDDKLLSLAPKLRVIITATSGFDHIDLEATARRNIDVAFTPQANVTSAAELTWGLMLACMRRLVEAHRAIKSGEWRREALVGRELKGKTLGIVGLGRIGSRVARFANAFEMKVVAFDPYKEPEAFSQLGAARVAFEELLMLSDIVTFHVPATAETKFMLSPLNMESMNRHAIIINASRGSVIAEQDLVKALNEGWIAGAGLDVFEREPLPRDSRLLTFQNVVMTPHLGATTGEAFAEASLEAALKMQQYISPDLSHGAQSLKDKLPPDDAWYRAGFSMRERDKLK